MARSTDDNHPTTKTCDHPTELSGGLSAAQLFEFSTAVQGLLNTRLLAMRAANLAQPLIAAQRVSVLVQRHQRFQVVAVSGVDSIASRSESVRLLAKAIETCSAMEQPVSYPAGSDSHSEELLPPQVVQAFEDYIEVSATSSLDAVPILESGGQVAGALVVESFNQTHNHQLAIARARAICPIIGRGLTASLQHEKTPLRWATWWLADLRRSTRWLLGSVLLFVALTLAMKLIQVPAGIECRGELVPREHWPVFIPENTVIERVHVTDGQSIAKGTPLATLYSPSLAIEHQELLGRVDVARQELSSVRGQRGRASSSRRNEAAAGSPSDTDLSSRQAVLELEIKHATEQLKLLQTRLTSLDIRSEHDAVIVLAHPLPELVGRPVRVGDHFMTLFPNDPAWTAEITVASNAVPQFLKAHQDALGKSNPNPMQVSLGLIAMPEAVVDGEIISIAGQSHTNPQTSESGLRVTVGLSSKEAERLLAPVGDSIRSGLVVNADIHMGKQSLGSWLFRDWTIWISDQIRFRLSPRSSPSSVQEGPK